MFGSLLADIRCPSPDDQRHFVDAGQELDLPQQHHSDTVQGKKDGFQVANVPARCLFIKLCDLCFFVAAVLDCDGQNLPISMHPHSSSNKSVVDLQEGLQYIAVDSVAEVCSHHSLLP